MENYQDRIAPTRRSVGQQRRRMRELQNDTQMVNKDSHRTEVQQQSHRLPPQVALHIQTQQPQRCFTESKQLQNDTERKAGQRLLKGKGKAIYVENHNSKRMRPESIIIREREEGSYAPHDTDSDEESTFLPRRSDIMPDMTLQRTPLVGTTFSAQNIQMPSVTVEEENVDYDSDEVDYGDDDIHSQNTIMNQIPTLHTNIRHFLGQTDVECRHYGALHWMAEKLTSSSLINPKFGMCCLQEKVRVPLVREPPRPLRELFEGNDARSTSFRNYIRECNAANAYTSLVCKLDERILKGRGPRPFAIHGELRHLTGGILPLLGNERHAVYSQLYIYDPAFALFVRGERNPNLNVDVLQTIQNTMLQFNVFYTKYRQAYAILDQMSHADPNFRVSLQYNKSTDVRRYNLPVAEEIAVIVPEKTYKQTGPRDIILHLRENNGLQQISECHPAYLPLHYVLLFPFGELGWSPTLRHWDAAANTYTNTKLSQMEYYSYRIFERRSEYSTILRAGKLFQEFLVDAWAATEQSKLAWLRFHQPTLRSNCYGCIADMTNDDLNPGDRGIPFILPSSHTGSGRHMHEIYQDSMAITRFHPHPDIFLTMTANPNWPEIRNAFFPRQTALDRPDLVARVFELKRKALMKEIKEKKVFGTVVAHVYTIEFQKRGLLHIHCLIFLKDSEKIRTSDMVDKFVSAEFPDKKNDPILFDTVSKCMVHGPCGDRDPGAPCMAKGKCTKGYPKNYTYTTTLDEGGYPSYRRRRDGREVTVRNNKKAYNIDVVPYNPHLSRMFNCHINVEICAGIRAVKYINKYIFKGGDRTTMVLGEHDEIQQYIDARYIGPAEAVWRLLEYQLHE
ncbi:uncharacterized protein LOC113312262 [Papaver somniferum]|uniref:uncharacterized protein LOC113312262 n=1 Tax=Papaver somniferum TaxID=3469 RepID=UPI000E6F60B4|nr:uncharacterized protein LOC113312262 [Papaver somniferum]